MNIDDLKSNWNSLGFSTGDLPPTAELLSRVRAGRVSTLRDRLASISRALALVCVSGVLLMIPYMAEASTLAILGICFFIFIGLMHLRNYRRVMRLNFSLMTVREALVSVCAIESSRARLRAIGMALGIPLVVYMCFTISSLYGEVMTYGCIAGAVIGMVIGLLINRKAVALIREMRRQLSEVQNS